MSRYLKVSGILSFVFLIGIFLVGCPFPSGIHPGTPGTTAATGNITGKVLAQGQTDYSGVTVAAEPTDGIKSASVQSMVSTRQACRAVIAAQATTDANGTYTLTGLPAGVYTLSAISKDGLEKAVTTSVTVSAGSTAQALLMILTQTGQIQGVVTLLGQSDSTGIVVFIAGTSYSAMTDINGNYLMSYVPASKNYTLVASKDGYVSAIRNVDVTVNKTTPVASIALAPPVAPQTTGSVSGTARLSDALAASAGIFVYLLGTSYICVTDADGNFILTGVALGKYTIMASKEGYAAQSSLVTIPPDASISFTLTPLGPYFVTYNGNGGTGNVPIDPNAYVQGSTVTVLGNIGNLVNAGYSFAGWTTVGGTAYTGGQTFTMGSGNVTLYATWTLSPGTPTALSGRLIDPVTGQPISEAMVTFSSHTTTTASDGSFSINLGRQAGTLTGDFGVNASGYSLMYMNSVSVEAGSNTQLVIPVSLVNSAGYPTRALTVIMRDQNGAEIPQGSRVELSIGSANGGFSKFGDVGYTTGGFTCQSPTFGTDCLVSVCDLSDGFAVMQRQVNLLTTNSLSLTHDTASTSTVSVTASGGVRGKAMLVTPYGTVEVCPGFSVSSSISASVPVANPYGYPGYWLQEQSLDNWLGTTSTKHFESASSPTTIPASVTLPPINFNLGPTSALDAVTLANSIAYSNGSGTLSIAAVPGASLYIFFIAESANMLCLVASSSASVILPSWLKSTLRGKTLSVLAAPMDSNDHSALSLLGGQLHYGVQSPNLETASLEPSSKGGWYMNSDLPF